MSPSARLATPLLWVALLGFASRAACSQNLVLTELMDCVDCDGRCVDVQRDPANCGRCGVVCAAGATCEAGICSCSPGLTSCGTACVDLAQDPDHCGSCDEACSLGGQCVSGNCVCAVGLADCGERCADTSRDPEHCGGCNAPCADAEVCQGGSCVCRPGLADCGSGCVDLQSDPNFCGNCQTSCAAATEFCSLGGCTTTECELQVPATEGCGLDDRHCVAPAALSTNPLHCGGCNQTCQVEEVCSAGQCRDYYAAWSCTSCPCATCEIGDACCAYPSSGAIICVKGGTTCP